MSSSDPLPQEIREIEEIKRRASRLYTAIEVEAALDAMAGQITQKLKDANPILLSVMNGAVVTAGKLAIRLDFPLQMDYLHATRYRNRTRGSDLEWKRYPETALRGRVVLVVDDILDEGGTLAAIRDYLQQQGAQAVYIAVLVNKLHERKVPGLTADFVGLEARDSYLFGYGMDYKGFLRNGAGIFAVHPDDCN